MIVGIVSAKGSPGVTTVALAIAATAGSDALFIELDPSGGSVECWTGAAGEPGLIPAASSLRRATKWHDVIDVAVEVVPGIRGLLAPTSGELAEAAVSAASGRLLPALAACEATIIVDGGRWAASQRTARRLAGCDLVVVLCSPTIAGVEAARWLVEPLQSAVASPVALVPIGDRPYGSSEIAPLVDAPVPGSVAWDPRGANALVVRGPTRAWRRSALGRSAASLLPRLSRSSGRELIGRD